jgi:hypothetical protein
MQNYPKYHQKEHNLHHCKNIWKQGAKKKVLVLECTNIESEYALSAPTPCLALDNGQWTYIYKKTYKRL